MVRILIVVLLLLTITSIVLSFSSVQTKLAKIATEKLHESFGTNISVKKVDLSFLGRVELKEVEIRDHHNDTLIFAKELRTSALNFKKILDNKVNLGEVDLEDAVFYMKRYADETDDSFAVFLKQLEGDKKKKKSPFILNSSKINLYNVTYRLLDENKTKNEVVRYNNIHGEVLDFKIYGPDVNANIRNLTFIDNHAIKVVNLTSDFSYSTSQMQFINTTLQTENSYLKATIVFDYKREDLIDFNDKVLITASFEESSVSVVDIKKFYKELYGDDVLRFTSNFEGTLNDFVTNGLKIQSKKGFVIDGDLQFKNSINQERGFSFLGDFNEFTSDYTLLKEILPNVLGKHLPQEIEKFGEFSINGTSFVNKSALDAQVEIQTEIGTIVTDMKLSNIDYIHNIVYKGHVNIIDFNLGKFVGDPLIGKLSMEGDVDGAGIGIENLNISVKGNATKHQYKGYTYKNIAVDGLFKNKQFRGNLFIDDENIKMRFKGMADLASSLNNYDFKAEVDFANLNKLNLFKRDSIAVLKGVMDVDIVGNSINNVIGATNFKNVSYVNQNDNYFFKDFKILSSSKDSIKSFTINSTDIINGRVRGKFNFNEMEYLARNALGSMSSHYKPFKVSPNQFVDFRLNIYNKIVEVFLPEVKMSPNTTIRGKIESDNQNFKLTFKSPQVEVFKNRLDAISLQMDNKNPLFNTHITVGQIKSKYYNVSDLNLLNITQNDTLFFRTEFLGGKQNTENYNLAFYYALNEDNKSILGIQRSNFNIKNKEWVINPQNSTQSNNIEFDLKTQIFDFKEFNIVSGKQHIKFHGAVKDTTHKDLKFTFDKVNVADITPYIDSLSLEGVLNGNLNFTQKEGVYNPTGELSIKNFRINDSYQGDLTADILAEGSYEKYQVNLLLRKEAYKSLRAQGVVDFTPPRPIVDLNVFLEQFKLNAFSPLGKDVLSKIRGHASGNFKVSGLMSNPDMNGTITLEEAGLKFPYLNVDYNFKGVPKVTLFKQSFNFNSINLIDTKNKTSGVLKGTISHSSFKDWNLDLDIDSDRLLVLDTEEDENSLYYGTGFISGNAHIYGFTDNLTIDVNAKTLNGTEFIIPLSDVKTVENSSLIHFKKVQEETLNEISQKELLLSKIKGVSLNFNLDVTKDAIAEIVIDKASGSSLRGSGTGGLLMEINTKGKFNMYGDFTVDNGIYNFIYGGLINKPFTVKKGGVISWDGSPYEAELNIEAVHTVKANPKSLLENLRTNRKLPVDLITKITGELFNSNQEFDILIPNASSVVASELAFILNDNDTNTKMRQFFSLLVSKSFFNENNIGATSSSAISGTTADIISGVVSDIFNSPESKLQVDFGYTTGDRTNIETQNIDDQVDISLATQINDRILINGKVGVPVGTKTESSVIGEVKVEFLWNEEDTFRSSIFNRQNEIQYTDEEEGYTQGVGLSYQIDFDNLSEMLEKLKLKKKKNKDSLEVSKGKLKKTKKNYDNLLFVVPSIF